MRPVGAAFSTGIVAGADGYTWPVLQVSGHPLRLYMAEIQGAYTGIKALVRNMRGGACVGAYITDRLSPDVVLQFDLGERYAKPVCLVACYVAGKRKATARVDWRELADLGRALVALRADVNRMARKGKRCGTN
jgi:hypothetical protein